MSQQLSLPSPPLVPRVLDCTEMGDGGGCGKRMLLKGGRAGNSNPAPGRDDGAAAENQAFLASENNEPVAT